MKTKAEHPNVSWPPTGDWWAYRSPFRHWRASDVLDEASYQAVSSSFRSFLDGSADQPKGRRGLRAGTANYDAQMLTIDDSVARLFEPFFSDHWIQSLHEFVAVPQTRRIDAALHSSPEGSRTGWIHTDFCSGWFDESSAGDGRFFADRSGCDYFTGRPKKTTASPKEYVRAATMIYYLCNDGWSESDGGETGLYGAEKQRDRTTTALVPPLNNTLLLFECSPHSYHRFIANPGRRRNSIILWLHTTVEDSESRWLDAVNRRRWR
ncbi:2OG-Fe(II) oxygenase [Streptomyces sp. NPDC020983]|uniref:2OG-Fe(II) oxygenase n=1 Tax=Streptomyces sp. NPDC020983 TaxID=3365106 RepID=UPI0037918B76